MLILCVYLLTHEISKIPLTIVFLANSNSFRTLKAYPLPVCDFVATKMQLN